MPGDSIRSNLNSKLNLNDFGEATTASSTAFSYFIIDEDSSSIIIKYGKCCKIALSLCRAFGGWQCGDGGLSTFVAPRASSSWTREPQTSSCNNCFAWHWHCVIQTTRNELILKCEMCENWRSENKQFDSVKWTFYCHLSCLMCLKLLHSLSANCQDTHSLSFVRLPKWNWRDEKRTHRPNRTFVNVVNLTDAICCREEKPSNECSALEYKRNVRMSINFSSLHVCVCARVRTCRKM